MVCVLIGFGYKPRVGQIPFQVVAMDIGYVAHGTCYIECRPSSNQTRAAGWMTLRMLQLLGLSDHELQEQMAKSHSYAFDIIPFKNYQEATRVLMERNMPDILHNSQTETAFMPKTHLPNIPRVVDEQEYEAKKGQLDERDLQLLDMKAEREDSQAAHGDIA